MVIVAVAMVADMAAMGMVALAAACLQAAPPNPLLRRRPWRVRHAVLPTRLARGSANNAVVP